MVFPEHEMGVRLGNALAGTNLIDYMELDPRYAVAEIRCPVEIAGPDAWRRRMCAAATA